MEFVRERIKRVQAGELNTDDCTIKGSLAFLRELHRRGVVLYLASGTDEEDVRKQAAVLGYAELFTGGIFGAVGDVASYSKKMVIDRIISENHFSGSQLAVFGDGPVELREARKRGGIAVGIASDEIRRYHLRQEKRKRLIPSGADVLVPDFSQGDRLIAYLFSK